MYSYTLTDSMSAKMYMEGKINLQLLDVRQSKIVTGQEIQ